MAVILCYGLIVERALRIALISRDGFGKLMAVGLGDDRRAAGLRRHRRRHRPDPADRPDHPVPLLRRLVAGRQLGDRRPAAAHLRPGPPAHAPRLDPVDDTSDDSETTQVVKLRMNKPIRVVSVFCLLLFLALLRQRDLPDVRPRGRACPTTPATGGSSPRPSPASAARSWSARTPIARSVPSDDKYKFQRTYPQPLQVRPDHRLLLLVRPDRRRALAELRARRRRLATVRHPPRRHAQQHRPQGRQRPADDQRRRAGRRVGRPEALPGDAQGAVVALEPTHRPGAGDGLHPDVRPQQARLARLRRRGRPRQAAQRRPARRR